MVSLSQVMNLRHYQASFTVYIRVHLGVIHSLSVEKCGMTSIYLYSIYGIIQSSLTALKIPHAPPIYPSLPTPNPMPTINIFFLLYSQFVYSFLEFYIVAIIQYVALEDWLFSFSNMHLRLLHIF